MNYTEKANFYFSQKYHCSQAVFAAFACELGLPEEQALKIGGCFGGGMCKGEVCGAVTGALMALGLKYGQSDIEDLESRKKANEIAVELLECFRKENGSYFCKELLGCDLGTQEGKKEAMERNLFTEFCPKMVESATRITEKIILKDFLRVNEYIDYEQELIQKKAAELFAPEMSEVEKVKVAYEFVRDKIPHSFDCNAEIITAKASDVLKYETGICHAKANLLAALLRSQGIPTGFCFQRITLAEDDSLGYCVHAYNAVYLNGKWIKLDARGNKPGVNAKFSLDVPVLAYQNRAEYDEYFWEGIYASPHSATMQMLEKAKSLQDIMDNIPDEVTELPDIKERA